MRSQREQHELLASHSARGPAQRRRSQRHRGTVLVLVVLLLFGMLGIAGLVVDLGLAKLTQARMQSAADLAALDGLRFRDELPPNVASPDIAPTPGELDVERRLHVNRMLTLYHTGDMDPVMGLAAGFVEPQWVLPIEDGFVIPDEHGNPRFEALRLISPTPLPYIPQMDADPGSNAANPEMASGAYQRNLDYPEDEVRDARINEAGLYERRDFVPAPDAPADDAQETASASSNAFFVQLRRSVDNIDPNDPDKLGGPLPNLFSLAAGGFQIRAPAVAAAGDATFDPSSSPSSDPSSNPSSPANYSVGRAMTAGPAVPEANLAGLAPFALERSFWQEYAGGDRPRDLTLRNRILTNSDAPAGTPDAGIELGISQRIATVGQIAGAVSSPTTLTESGKHHVYFRIYDATIAAGEKYIIGFGYAEWNLSGTTLTLHRPVGDRVGGGNVSGALAESLSTRLTAAQVERLFQLHLDGVDKPTRQPTTPRFTHPLYAPVLVTRTLGPAPLVTP